MLALEVVTWKLVCELKYSLRRGRNRYRAHAELAFGNVVLWWANRS